MVTLRYDDHDINEIQICGMANIRANINPAPTFRHHKKFFFSFILINDDIQNYWYRIIRGYKVELARSNLYLFRRYLM